MRKREFATCVALGIVLIGWSVSDLSQILINSKKKNSLILEKKIIGIRLHRQGTCGAW